MRARIVTGLVLAAEAGHLAAAFEEADTWPLLSGCHVLAAAAYGMAIGAKRNRLAVTLAATLATVWILTRLFGLPTYLTLTRLPVTTIGVVTTLVEVALVITPRGAGGRGSMYRNSRKPRCRCETAAGLPVGVSPGRDQCRAGSAGSECG